MAVNNIKCLQLFTSIAILIAIVQANHTLEENSTLTKIPNNFTIGSETKSYNVKQHNTYRDSAVISMQLSHKTYSANKTFQRVKKSHTGKTSNGSGRHKRQDNVYSSKKYKKQKIVYKTNMPFKNSKLNGNLIAQTFANQNKKRETKLYDKRSRGTTIRKLKDKNSELPDNINDTCWAKWNVYQIFEDMATLNKKYRTVIVKFSQQMGSQFDEEMLNNVASRTAELKPIPIWMDIELRILHFGDNTDNKWVSNYAVMIANRSVSERALHSAGGVAAAVPAGLQLGGYAVLKHYDALFFFHRLKLRNKTSFFIEPIQSDFKNMTLQANLYLGDLRLAGNYERLKIDNIPNNLYYAPTYGSVDFLLRNVKYKLEGRYRVANGRLLIEQIISNITGKDAFIGYDNLPGTYSETSQLPRPIIEFNALEDFMDRLKIDLNEWVKDYFNDYLIYFGLGEKRINALFELYDKQKTLIHNDYVDYIVKIIRWRLNLIEHNIGLKADFSKVTNLFNLPEFTIFTINGMTLKLYCGQVEGLNSIHRRSTATGPSFAQNSIYRDVDVTVGFSNLRVVYKYQAIVNPESPPMQGQLVLTANDLTAHMALVLYKRNNSVRLHFDQIHPLKVQALTIEGPVNRMIGSFRHILENHIVALLTNVLMNQVKEIKNNFICTGYDVKFDEPFPHIKSFDHDSNFNNGNFHGDDAPRDSDKIFHDDENGNDGNVTLPNKSPEETMSNEDDNEENLTTSTISGVEHKTNNQNRPQFKLPQDEHGNRPMHVEPKDQFKLYEHKGAGVRRWVGRQMIAKKGGKDSKSVLVIKS